LLNITGDRSPRWGVCVSRL